jgi:hypothetical protein
VAVRTTACRNRLGTAPVSIYKVAVFGQYSAQIAGAQRALGVPVTGWFRSPTFYKVAAYQSRARIPVTGALDKTTWKRLTGR